MERTLRPGHLGPPRGRADHQSRVPVRSTTRRLTCDGTHRLDVELSSHPCTAQPQIRRYQGSMLSCGHPSQACCGKGAERSRHLSFLLCKAVLVGLCKQLLEYGHLTGGAGGFTTWNETREHLSDAHINGEARHILAVNTVDDEDNESDEESSCLAASRNHGAPQERPIRGALAGGILDRDLVAAAGKKELD